MSEIAMILDADAILAYTKHTSQVAKKISLVADDQLRVMLPALCLAEAYRRVDGDGWYYLEVLTNHPVTVVGPVDAELCPILGGWSRTLGRLDLAHAALEAAAHPSADLMTSERALVTTMLPNERQIVDV